MHIRKIVKEVQSEGVRCTCGALPRGPALETGHKADCQIHRVSWNRYLDRKTRSTRDTYKGLD